MQYSRFTKYYFSSRKPYRKLVRINDRDLRWLSSTASNTSQEVSPKPLEAVPSLRILPVLGTTWTLLPIIGKYKLNRLHIAALEKRKLLGDIYREKFGALNIVMLFRPDDIEVVFRNEGPYPSRGENESIIAYRNSRKQWYSTTGLLLLEGKGWWDLRSKTQKHLLKPKTVQAYLSPMQDVAKDFIAKMLNDRDSNKEIPNFLGELYKWSLESVAVVGLDTRLGCLKINQTSDSESIHMINSVQAIFEGWHNLEAISGNLPFWKLFPTPTWKKFVKAGDTFSEIAFKYINRSLEDLKKNEGNEEKELTLLQIMMVKGLDVSEAMVVVADMILAGIDTTAHSVGFFLYMIARNPDKQEILYQDILKWLPTKESKINPEVFNELRYLKSCIKETQRLMPVLGGIVRVLPQDAVLSGYKIPAGTLVAGNLHGICIDEKYFPNPDKYLPERWLDKENKPHPFAFLPFGFGVRSCIGRRLAEMEIICLITEIIRIFKVEYHYEDIGIHTRLINCPDKPLRFTFIER